MEGKYLFLGGEKHGEWIHVSGDSITVRVARETRTIPDVNGNPAYWVVPEPTIYNRREMIFPNRDGSRQHILVYIQKGLEEEASGMLREFIRQRCCERDTDFDGSCDRHPPARSREMMRRGAMTIMIDAQMVARAQAEYGRNWRQVVEQDGWEFEAEDHRRGLTSDYFRNRLAEPFNDGLTTLEELNEMTGESIGSWARRQMYQASSAGVVQEPGYIPQSYVDSVPGYYPAQRHSAGWDPLHQPPRTEPCAPVAAMQDSFDRHGDEQRIRAYMIAKGRSSIIKSLRSREGGSKLTDTQIEDFCRKLGLGLK